MAFENVFGNIDFMAPVRSGQQDRAQLAQMLGNVIQQKQYEQEMDLKRRQLEAKGSDFNLKRTAENALMKRNMGMPTTPQEDAAIKTMGQVAPPSYSTDPYGNVVSRPSGWSALGGRSNPATGQGTFTGQPMPTQQPTNIPPRPAGVGSYGQGSNQAMQGVSYDQIKPDITMSDLTPMDQADIEGVIGGSPLPPTPNYDNSPIGEIDTGKAKTNLSKYAAEKNIDLKFMDEKQKRELAFQMQKDEMKASRAKDLAKPAKLAESSIMIEDIGRSLDILKDKNGVLPKAGTVGSVLDYFPETNAGRLATHLKSVQNLTGFGKLAGMREQSPTGSSGLGALSEQEMEGLKSTSGNIEIKQRPEDLEYNLKRLHNQQMDLVHGTPQHIQSIAQEKGLPQNVVKQLSFRYDLGGSSKPTREEIMQELRRRRGQ